MPLTRGRIGRHNEGSVFFTTDMKGSYMKKILAYLLVLVSLMTLFCGTAGAADNSMDKNGYATTYVSMLVYDTDAKAAKYENVPVGCWTVVGRCYYATSDGRTYYPESASVQKATFSPYKGGISSTTTAQYQSSTSQIMENGKRTQVSLHYSCPILVKHYTNASKQNAKATYSEYIYSTNITTTSLQSTTTIYFYRYN